MLLAFHGLGCLCDGLRCPFVAAAHGPLLLRAEVVQFFAGSEADSFYACK